VRKPTSIAGVEALVGQFDVFLVDQFGVLHDGSAPYPGAVDALTRLKAVGKRVILLSNSGRRVEPNARRAAALGFRALSYDDIVSSGEVAWRLLKDRALGLDLPPGAACLLLARDGDTTAMDGLSLRRTEDAAQAEFVIIGGSEGDRLKLADYRAMLAPAAERRTPAICSNPDRIMLTPSGPCFGAGQIAELYASLGGPVMWIGKPYPEIYEFALRGIASPKTRIVAIGDSVEHDVAGGRRAGIATVLVCGGILAGMSDSELTDLYEEHAAVPDHVLPRFIWR
jgi:HAD superfamily hydrolase (TIGR01459 family)